jgi:hypothetical protein
MILYLICGFGMVTCTVSPLSRLTAHLLPVYRANITTKYTAVQNMDETIADVGFSIIENIHICITTNDHKIMFPRNILTILKVSKSDSFVGR